MESWQENGEGAKEEAISEMWVVCFLLTVLIQGGRRQTVHLSLHVVLQVDACQTC